MVEPVSTIAVISAIASVVNIVKDLPAAVSVAKSLGLDVGLLKNEPEKLLSCPSQVTDSEFSAPIDIMVGGLKKELEKLCEDYHRYEASWATHEREEHQKRVAAKACRLMSHSEDVLKDIVKGFDKLKKLFCSLSSS